MSETTFHEPVGPNPEEGAPEPATTPYERAQTMIDTFANPTYVPDAAELEFMNTTAEVTALRLDDGEEADQKQAERLRKVTDLGHWVLTPEQYQDSETAASMTIDEAREHLEVSFKGGLDGLIEQSKEDENEDDATAWARVQETLKKHQELSDELVARHPELTPATPTNDDRNRGRGTRGSGSGGNGKKAGQAAAGGAPNPPKPPVGSGDGSNDVPRPPRPPRRPEAPKPATTPEAGDEQPKKPVKAARKAYEQAYKERLDKGVAKGLEGDDLEAYMQKPKFTARLEKLGENLEDEYRARAERRGQNPNGKKVTEAFNKYKDEKLNAKLIAMYQEHSPESEEDPIATGARARFGRAWATATTLLHRETRQAWFNDQEKGKRRRVIGRVIGAALVGAALYSAVKIGVHIGEHAAQQSTGGTGGTPPPEAPKAPVHETASLTHKGDTIWHEVAQHKPNLHGKALHDEVQRTLDANNMSWEDAKHMHVGQQFNLIDMQPAPTGTAQAAAETANQAAQHTETAGEYTGLSPQQWAIGELAVAGLIGGAYVLGRSGGRRSAEGSHVVTETETTTTTETAPQQKAAPKHIPGMMRSRAQMDELLRIREEREAEEKKENKKKAKTTKAAA